MTIPCLGSHPRKFIHEKLQDDQTSKFCTSKTSQYTYNKLVYGHSKHFLHFKLELGDILQKNRKEGILSYRYRNPTKNFIPANRHTIRIPVYRQNTDILLKYQYVHQHINTNSLLFSQCAVYMGYCESERFFQFSTGI